MADKGIIDQNLADEMLADWLEHRNNPDSIFFSPIVVDAAGRIEETETLTGFNSLTSN